MKFMFGIGVYDYYLDTRFRCIYRIYYNSVVDRVIKNRFLVWLGELFYG